MRKINLIPVKRSLVTAAGAATLLAFSVSALATNFTIEFFASSPKLIDLAIDTINLKTGDFVGEAFGTKSGELWEVTGTIVNDKIEIEFDSPKGRILATGKIDKDGTILGRAANEQGELFEWESSDALKA